jgi:hypothetical protein
MKLSSFALPRTYLGLKEFSRCFTARMVDHPDFVALYPDRIDGYAAQVAPLYWKKSKTDGRSPEDCADEDLSYWGR